MITISGLTIKIHKGNSAGFQLKLTGEGLPENNTIIRFRVRKGETYKSYVIEKLIPIEDGIIDVDFYPEDTANLVPGNYYWNLTILYENGDEPWTLLEEAPRFVILPEDGRCGV